MVEELCKTCAHYKSCTLYDKFEDTVIYCENYHPNDTGSGQYEEYQVQELKGLCKNCDKRYTCRFQKPEGGVWHCEEYE